MKKEINENPALSKMAVMQSVLLPSELRVGNLIFSKETQEVQKITGITEEHPFFNSITFDYPNWDEIDPIPVTKEWLLIFGYKQKGSYYRVNYSRFAEVIIHSEGVDVCVFSVHLRHIRYLHELQNLYFSLTGCELTVA